MNFRKTLKIVLTLALNAAALSAHAADTFVNLTGTAYVFSNGSTVAETPFTATIHYDTSLLNFYPYGVSYAAGYPAINATPNPDIGSITLKTTAGSLTSVLGGIDVDYYTIGGTPASIFSPAVPPKYAYSAVFYSSDFAFSFITPVPSTLPLTETTPFWLPTAGDSNLTSIDGAIVPLQANLQYWSSTNVALQVNSYSITSSVASVPEPKTYGMLLIGLGLIGFTSIRRKAAQA